MTTPRQLFEGLSPNDRRLIGTAMDLAAGNWRAGDPTTAALIARLRDPRTSDGRRLRQLLRALSPEPAAPRCCPGFCSWHEPKTTAA